MRWDERQRAGSGRSSRERDGGFGHVSGEAPRTPAMVWRARSVRKIEGDQEGRELV
jgi:hypothetical protein